MRWTIALAVLAAVGTAAGSASATPPAPVAIEIHSETGSGVFTASGGGLCPAGVTTDVVRFSGYESDQHVNFHVVKTFTCGDGSGSFTMDMQAHYFFGAPTDSGAWVIVSGTGSYADLKGAGSVTGDEGEGFVDDHLTGAVH